MILSSLLTILGLIGGVLASSGALAAALPKFPLNAGCGEVNVFYTGFTAYHPYVLAQGSDPVDIDRRLRNATANLVKAGYNTRVLFQGPEQPVSNIADRMKGVKWTVDAIGFGIRGYANATATATFEDRIYQFQKSAPLALTVFNWGPDSFVEAVTRRVPLREDCSDKPGRLYAYEEVCDPTVCEKTTTILDGDIRKLVEGI